MADKYIMVAISPNAAYNTAVVDWKWHCEQRYKPEFQRKDGVIITYIGVGLLHKLNKFKGDIYIYLGKDWDKRIDAYIINDAIKNERFKVIEIEQ